MSVLHQKLLSKIVIPNAYLEYVRQASSVGFFFPNRSSEFYDTGTIHLATQQRSGFQSKLKKVIVLKPLSESVERQLTCSSCCPTNQLLYKPDNCCTIGPVSVHLISSYTNDQLVHKWLTAAQLINCFVQLVNCCTIGSVAVQLISSNTNDQLVHKWLTAAQLINCCTTN